MIIPPKQRCWGVYWFVGVSHTMSVCRTQWPLTLTYIFKVIRPWLKNRVRSVAFTVLDGFFLCLAQMITIIRGCVACYFFFQNLKIWIFSKFFKFFGLDLEKKIYSSLMDSFHIWYKWSLVWESVLHIMTFDLDMYLQGHSTLTLKIVSAL